MYSSDSDEAPEDVLFSVGREKALHDFKVENSERKKPSTEKEWRRKREMKYKEQKEQKFISDEILMQAEAEFEKQKYLESSEEESSEEDETELADGNIEKESESETEEERKVEIEVINTKEPRPLMQSAMDYKAKCLYGKRIRRIDVLNAKKMRMKRTANSRFKSRAVKAKS